MRVVARIAAHLLLVALAVGVGNGVWDAGYNQGVMDAAESTVIIVTQPYRGGFFPFGAVFGFFFLFLLGASTTKDFSDMQGDEAAGCRTLPIRYGVDKAAKMISPFFVLPWLLLPLGAWLEDPGHPGQAILTGNPWLLTGLGLTLAAWGSYTLTLILKDPAALAEVENHPSWTHMYLMMMLAQVGFVVAYLV